MGQSYLSACVQEEEYRDEGNTFVFEEFVTNHPAGERPLDYATERKPNAMSKEHFIQLNRENRHFGDYCPSTTIYGVKIP